MMKKTLIFIVASMMGVASSWAAFSVETTRVVYEEKNKSAQFTVANKGKKNYLVQSWIEDANGKHSMDFLAVAPLFKLNGDSKQSIQIIRNSTQPGDRETLYWINIKFVEPSPKGEENVLRYSVTNKIKLIHRPHVLQGVEMPEQVKNLKVSSDGQLLTIENPGAVYINLNNLLINEKNIENPGYISPHETVRIKLKDVSSPGSRVRVNYINDFGASLNEEFGI